MKPIKFRVWDVEKKIYYRPDDKNPTVFAITSQGYLFNISCSSPFKLIKLKTLSVPAVHRLFKVEYFTGHLDINGKEIYDGDITDESGDIVGNIRENPELLVEAAK